MLFSKNIQKIRLLIDDYKTVDSVRLIGVTKYLDLIGTEQAIISGVTDIGENRLQEAEEKITALQPKYPNVTWHFLGRIQSNKAKKIVKLFDYIHSVESYEKLLLIDELCQKENKVVNVLLQVDIAKEATKQGMDKEALFQGLDNLKNLKKANFVGIMAIAPFTQEKEILASTFQQTKEIADSLLEKNINCQELSMGMSNDFLVALQEGSTMLRLGTIIFKEENND